MRRENVIFWRVIKKIKPCIGRFYNNFIGVAIRILSTLKIEFFPEFIQYQNTE